MRRHNSIKDHKWRELYIRQMRAGGDPSTSDDRWPVKQMPKEKDTARDRDRDRDLPGVGGARWRDLYLRQLRSGGGESSYDRERAVFVSMSHELKEEGNRLFQRRDYEVALIKYEKAIKLLPDAHPDIAYLRSNMAECYIQLGISEYPHAIHECTLALDVTPKYSKALLKRARCYEALDMLDLALSDVRAVLKIEPKNLMAHEIEARLRRMFDSVPLPEEGSSPENANKSKFDAEDKLVVEEKKVATTCKEDDIPKRTVKLVFREEIRWAQIPLSCDILKLRKVISDRFPSSKSVVVKFKDEDGDLVTITTSEELRWAQDSSTSMKLYVVEVDPSQDPFYDRDRDMPTEANLKRKEVVTCISDWIVEFAKLFNNYVGFDIDAYIDLHEVGMKIYSEAMEETVTSEEAQDLFGLAEDKFQELAALALFNWGNVHMSKARRRVYFKEEESVLERVKKAYEWAQKQFVLAGERYEEALKIKPEFYEAVLALGQHQFELAKLSWYYAVGTGVDLEMWPSGEVLMLYNNAEENMERGMRMWDELEKRRLDDWYSQNNIEVLLQKMKMDSLFKQISVDEVEEQASNIRSQIYVLWGTMLYERSVMEFKLGLPVWHECLEVAIEKFELAGASPTDIAVMIKNHCSNETGLEGLGFNIDEIVQAWNEMYEAKKWQRNISSFRLEPLLRRRVSKLYYALEGA
ncbi:Octicosapeptide/Phox/Bem1p (PB1) domain-containing protein / tetratricopeptide repeat (TPR)-containing protein [Striga hermonthica]|uniref:Octicosapeptide/Phox/Bem1p (PB1) domain-containing protein / tetratricopeptide repeat (TPR)-containing protein n=1 Tax=Striga hermonthica TaxID=68872 RepID=A0A9N7MGC5_STRHE|nr:Octicosapeptide/Phox/Bem1p (PB1) domain-containing protein / tetratricopeptide repeat (TPR)-containing protein [Striga hermonthica]